MSTLSVTTITTANATTDLTLRSGNSSGAGIIIPANGQSIIFQSNSSTNSAFYIVANGNVGIGIANPTFDSGTGLEIQRADVSTVRIDSVNNSTALELKAAVGAVAVSGRGNYPLLMETNGIERMRIDNSGGVYIGKTTTALNVAGWYFTSGIGSSYAFTMGGATNEAINFNNFGTGTYDIAFRYQGTTLGYIRTTSTTVSYVNLSDYRLKENIKSMTGALSKVMQLNPVTYTWKSDGSDGQGFIAHELQSIVPDCVTGEKDAVDKDGNPVYQGIDPSKLVATLTAAIQELSSKLDEANARIEALESRLNAN